MAFTAWSTQVFKYEPAKRCFLEIHLFLSRQRFPAMGYQIDSLLDSEDW